MQSIFSIDCISDYFLQILLNTNYAQCFLLGNFLLKIIISRSSCFFKPIIIFLKTQRLFNSIRCVKCSFITLIHFASLCVKSFQHLISVSKIRCFNFGANFLQVLPLFRTLSQYRVFFFVFGTKYLPQS